jgi:hypothetical protein
MQGQLWTQQCAPFSSAELKQVVLNLLDFLVLEYNKKNADAAVRAELKRGALQRPIFFCIFFVGL